MHVANVIVGGWDEARRSVQRKAGSIRRFVSIVIGGRLHGREALTLDIQPPLKRDHCMIANGLFYTRCFPYR